MKCSFCIIPSTRGRQRSRSVEEVVTEVQALADGGYREVVVTGVQISEYAHDGRRLYDLVSALLRDTTVPRLRLTSIAPWKFDDRLLELWQNPRLCRHIHMSLQSGSSATLRRMRRPYSADQYAELADKLRRHIPGLALTTDVIVGFPGESDEEFAQSMEFVQRMAFARPHIFTFSPRAGTHAESLPDHVPHAVKKERTAKMIEASKAGDEEFLRGQLGRLLEVVWEEKRGDLWTGLTDNYVRVHTGSDQDLSGELGPCRMVRLQGSGIYCEPVSRVDPELQNLESHRSQINSGSRLRIVS